MFELDKHAKALTSALKRHLDSKLKSVEASLSEVRERLSTVKDGRDGATGPKGDKGDAGERGEKGETGAVGAIGERGEPGLPGDRGEKGDAGTDGRDGRDGKDGAPGTSAAQLSILPSIATGKAYARNTFASHNGGLWHSFRETDPVEDLAKLLESGWAVVVDGIASFEEKELDERTIESTTIFSSGKRFTSQRKSRHLIYRRTFDELRTYDAGDVVTWGGSMWHCNVDGAKGVKPKSIGSEEIWTLSVKQGDRGRDGADGAPSGPRPPIKLGS